MHNFEDAPLPTVELQKPPTEATSQLRGRRGHRRVRGGALRWHRKPFVGYWSGSVGNRQIQALEFKAAFEWKQLTLDNGPFGGAIVSSVFIMPGLQC